MSENNNQLNELYEDDTSGGGERQGTPKQLRDFAERTAEENKRLKAENEKLLKDQKTAALKTFAADKGLPDEALELIGDKDPEEWYSKFGHLVKSNSSDTQPTEETPTREAPSQESVEQLQAAVDVQPGRFTPGNDEISSKLDAIEASAKSEDEVLAQLRELGALAE